MKIIFKYSLVFIFIITNSVFYEPIVAESIETRASKKTYGGAVVQRLVKVYDGDTFKVDIKDYPPIIGQNMSIRIAGIDTPELRSKLPRIKALAQQAKNFAKQILEAAKKIELKDIKRGKYFRIIATVLCDGVNLGDYLIQKGIAKPYNGKGPRPDWSTPAVS